MVDLGLRLDVNLGGSPREKVSCMLEMWRIRPHEGDCRVKETSTSANVATHEADLLDDVL